MVEPHADVFIADCPGGYGCFAPNTNGLGNLEGNLLKSSGWSWKESLLDLHARSAARGGWEVNSRLFLPHLSLRIWLQECWEIKAKSIQDS